MDYWSQRPSKYAWGVYSSTHRHRADGEAPEPEGEQETDCRDSHHKAHSQPAVERGHLVSAIGRATEGVEVKHGLPLRDESSRRFLRRFGG